MPSASPGHIPAPMKVVRHPGVAAEVRMSWVEVPSATRRRLHLGEGEDLFTSIHRVLDADGAAGATFSLLSGDLAFLSVMTGGPGQDIPMTFHGPFEIAGPIEVVGGAGLTGVDEQGERTSHCHAAFLDAHGRMVGGHLMASKALAGPGGIALDLTCLDRAAFVRRLDAETGFVIFHPEVVR